MSLVTILASAARTTSSTSSTVSIHPRTRSLAFHLQITNAATDAADTLNVYLQSSPNGTDWDDFVSFTQVLGNGADSLNYVAFVNLEEYQSSQVHAMQNGALSAETIVQGPIFPSYVRAKYVIADSGDGDQSFTFSLTMTEVR